ncbi:type II secretion system F family protein [Lacipirellula sp.]|uniref:type II secretion system F family protein n=1 Tax=Lacipirellula sp. TaxID=2691419 RepID=UPI003D095C17
MSSLWIVILVFTAVAAAVAAAGSLAYDNYLRNRFAVQERVKELSGIGDSTRSASLFKDLKRLADQSIQRRTFRETIDQLFEQSATTLTLKQALALAAALAAGVSLPAAWFAPMTIPLAACVGFAIVPAGLYFKRFARQKQLSQQLPEAFQMISRSVSAGQTVPAALRIIADDFEEPISEEFALCYEQQNLGMSRETALRKLAQRTGIMELQLFVVALLVQERSGGDLVGLLDNLASMIRKRLKLQNRIRALTGEGRMQAIVLIVLPIAALAAMLTLSPDYAQSLLDRPWLLGCAAGAQTLGALWIRRIVNFEV